MMRIGFNPYNSNNTSFQANPSRFAEGAKCKLSELGIEGRVTTERILKKTGKILDDAGELNPWKGKKS